MGSYTATVHWQRGDQTYSDGKYSRGHNWHFDGGATVPASASPHIVPLPYSVEQNVDPEEAFVAAASSCHMLFFLHFAQQDGYVVDDYRDEAFGTMAKNDEGRVAVTHIALNPVIAYEGVKPDEAAEADLHHRAHEACFIANSVKTEIEIVSDR